jgi:hypothetical protein
VLFEVQSTACLIEAINSFERDASTFSPTAARRNALRFEKRRFADEFFGLVNEIVDRKNSAHQREAESRLLVANPHEGAENPETAPATKTAASVW